MNTATTPRPATALHPAEALRTAVAPRTGTRTALGALGVPAQGPRWNGHRRRPRTTTRPVRAIAVVAAVAVLGVLAVVLGAPGATAASSPVAVVAPDAPASGLVGAAPGAPGDCGFFDPAACVTDAINSLVGDAVTSAVNAGLGLLSATLLATPRVDQVARVAELWNSSWQLVLALYAMIVVLAAIGVMVAGVRGQTSVREALPRLLVGFLAGALSLPLSGIAITLANALSAGVLGEGLDAASVVNGLGVLLGSILTAPAGGGLGLIGLGVGLLVVIELGAVLVVFIARVVLTVLLVVGAPLALMFHALPQTEGIARWWWRAFAGVLAVQVLQSLTLVTALRVVLGPDGLASVLFPGPSSGEDVAGGLVNALVTLVLLWVLWKIPFWVLHAVRGTQGLSRRGFVGNVARTAVVAAAFSAAGGPAGLGAAAAGRGGLGRLAGAFMGRAAGRGLAGLVNSNRGGTGNSRGAARGPGKAGGPGPDPDPYARVQADRDGQLRLPLGPLPRGPRPRSRGAAGPGGSSAPEAGRAPGAGAPPRGRQLRLPFDQPAPDPFTGNRPMRGGPNPGQYPLPFDGLTRQPRPAGPTAPPAAGTGPARGRRRPAGRGVQLELPLDPYRGNRPVRRGPDAGQYPLPLDGLTRRPPAPPSAPAPAPRPPRPAGRPPGVQLELPFDPYRGNRALRGGQYPLPLDGLTRQPRPTPPPPAPPPAPRREPDPRPGRSGRGPARPVRPRDAQMPLPFDPPPRRTR